MEQPGDYYHIISSVNSAGNYSYWRQNCIRKPSKAVSCAAVHLTLVRSGCSTAVHLQGGVNCINCRMREHN